MMLVINIAWAIVIIIILVLAGGLLAYGLYAVNIMIKELLAIGLLLRDIAEEMRKSK